MLKIFFKYQFTKGTRTKHSLHVVQGQKYGAFSEDQTP